MGDMSDEAGFRRAMDLFARFEARRQAEEGARGEAEARGRRLAAGEREAVAEALFGDRPGATGKAPTGETMP